MRGRALTVFLLMVLFVTALSAGVWLLAVKGEPPSEEDSEAAKAEAQASAAYKKIHEKLDGLRRDDRLADMVRVYGTFSPDHADTPTGKRVQAELKALYKEIDGHYLKDSKTLAGIIQKRDYTGCLEHIEKMERYCYGPLLQAIQKEKQQIQKHFDDQTRDFYHLVREEFRKKMLARQPKEALAWMHAILDDAPLPKPLERAWLKNRGTKYDEIKAAVGRSDYARIAELVEPELAMLRTLGDMDTPRMILFDVACAAFVGQAMRDAEAGVQYLARDRTAVNGNLVVIDAGKPYWITPRGERRELVLEQLTSEQLAILSKRGLDSDLAKTQERVDQDARLHLRMGVLYMYSSVPEDGIKAEYHFKYALNQLKMKLAQLFLDVLNSSSANPGK